MPNRTHTPQERLQKWIRLNFKDAAHDQMEGMLEGAARLSDTAAELRLKQARRDAKKAKEAVRVPGL